jgi:hypothetical protein
LILSLSRRRRIILPSRKLVKATLQRQAFCALGSQLLIQSTDAIVFAIPATAFRLLAILPLRLALTASLLDFFLILVNFRLTGSVDFGIVGIVAVSFSGRIIRVIGILPVTRIGIKIIKVQIAVSVRDLRHQLLQR